MNSVLTSLADLSLRESSDGRLEVLQDLDLFYIKQLAHGLKVCLLFTAHSLSLFCRLFCWIKLFFSICGENEKQLPKLVQR
jgi:hypothetical protein